jgi:hypothetical protein
MPTKGHSKVALILRALIPVSIKSVNSFFWRGERLKTRDAG